MWCLTPANLVGSQFYSSLMFYFGGVTEKNLVALKQRILLATEAGSVIIHWICFLIHYLLSVILLDG